MMDGYLFDTNIVSFIMDERHVNYGKARQLLNDLGNAPVWVSIVAIAEIEFGLRIALTKDVKRHSVIREELRKIVSGGYLLFTTKHTIIPYAELRSALFEKYGPKDRRNKIKKKWPEDLKDVISSKELGIQENDIWIAAQAMERNLILVTNDRMVHLQEVSKEFLSPLRILIFP